MKNLNKILIALVVITIAACGTSKKSARSKGTTSTNAVESNNQVSQQGPYLLAPPPSDIKAPGNEELIAIQTQYKDATLENLKQGHVIYTETACVKCHVAQGIYKYDVITWKSIIDDMSAKAEISDLEKDAVYKNVMAIKATQPK